MVDYNLLRPERAPLIARAAAAGKGVLAGMPLAMGHLGLKVAALRAPRDVWYAARGLARHRREVALGASLGFLRRLPDLTANQAALAYVLAERDLAAAVIGTTRRAHLEEDVAASGRRLPAAVLARIHRAQARFSGT
jgi:aryl-alcohol dehydrogenase-like predicted oxidoreductase